MKEQTYWIRIWARKDAMADGNADFALNITDIIALPTFDNRAMENWGLLTFDESLLLLQPNDKLTEKKIMIFYIVSHEIGHQACGSQMWHENGWEGRTDARKEGGGRHPVLGSAAGMRLPLPARNAQLQQFCSNMLEEHQRLTVQAKLQTIKNENLKNKERSARIVAWLRKNT
ncbi:LVRN [Cervus elaphus hippelaphus]|uniref:LVRN n=1 Tax=Cervus elaphus hippelaphus TaxID=46360 RepID=A0A212CTD1_CEREH|nr:LVRN [Cervus elaphus hippelaphus]